MLFFCKLKEFFLYLSIFYIFIDYFFLLFMVFGDINWIIVYKYRFYKYVEDFEIVDDRVYE